MNDWRARLFTLLFVIAGVIGMVSSVAAAVSVTVGGGPVFPATGFGDEIQRGWQGVGSLEVPLNSHSRIGVEGAYAGMDRTRESAGGIPQARFYIWRAGVLEEFDLRPPGTFVPVLGAGAGIYGTTIKFPSLSGDVRLSDMFAGLSLRAGLLVNPELPGAFGLMAGLHAMMSNGGSMTFFDLTASWRFGGGE
jgi:hypothetical protein